MLRFGSCMKSSTKALRLEVWLREPLSSIQRKKKKGGREIRMEGRRKEWASE